MASNRDILKQTSQFADVDDAVMDEFMAEATERTFAEGDVVFAELGESDEIYLVLEGKLVHQFALLDAGAESDDFIAGPGQFSNVVKLVAEGPNYVSCLAQENTRVLAWKAASWKAICKRHPEVGYELATRVAALLVERVMRLNQMLLDNVSWGLE